MSLNVVYALKIIGLTGTIAYLIFAYFQKHIAETYQKKAAKYLQCALIGLTVFAIYAWVNGGSFFYIWNSSSHWQDVYSHHHEDYHFFFGSKYLPEVGYSNLYLATLAAAREEKLNVSQATMVRDPISFQAIPVADADKMASLVIARFSPERWQAFKEDTVTFFNIEPYEYTKAFNDHGNTGSPVWAMLPHFITQHLSPTRNALFVLSLLDISLLLIMFYSLSKSFGWRISALAIIIFTSFPYVFDFTFGSILRFDWLFASVMALCFYEKKRYFGAGIFLAYAVSTKIFPLVFMVGLLIKAGQNLFIEKKLLLKYKQQMVGFMAGLILFVGGSAVYFGGFTIWGEYYQRIHTAYSQDFNFFSFSYQGPFASIARDGVVSFSQQGFHIAQPFQDGEINQIINRNLAVYYFSLALIGLAILWLILRSKDDVDAVCLSSLFFFFFFVPYTYYTPYLIIFSLYWLRKMADRKYLAMGLLFLAIWIYYYIFKFYNREDIINYAASFWLSLYFLAFILVELLTPTKELAKTALEAEY